MKERNPLGNGWREIGEQAERYDRSRRTFKNWCNRGLRHAKIGAITMIHDDDLDEWFSRHARGGNRDKNGVDVEPVRKRLRGA